MKWCHLWIDYPFDKAYRFFQAAPLRYEIRGCVLHIGPIALSVWWRRKRIADATKGGA